MNIEFLIMKNKSIIFFVNIPTIMIIAKEYAHLAMRKVDQGKSLLDLPNHYILLKLFFMIYRWMMIDID